jgi:hypothetical protein
MYRKKKNFNQININRILLKMTMYKMGKSGKIGKLDDKINYMENTTKLREY